ncbi:Gfo/Idh/MocA family protein, partial [candidate division KSB1 bacterium]
MTEQESNISRRNFIGTAALAGVALAACGKTGTKSGSDIYIPTLYDQAPDGPVLKAGLVGCGGRGTGAAWDFLRAGPNLQIVALADTFKDRVDSCREQIKKRSGQEVPASRCFVGLDSYKKVLDTDIDVVLMATPPYYRPVQFAAAVEAGKHVFIEKPMGVDPVGCRSVMQTASIAKTKGLNVMTGTHRRHWEKYTETLKRILDGAIGDIVAARIYYNTSQLWYRQRQKGWSNLDWMIRDWVNWRWLSGDHIVEQHIHDIDAVNWFTGSHPVKAVGLGSRQRRPTGDQYDNFSVDFEFENGMHVQSMSRQIDGCINNVSQTFVGTKGWALCRQAEPNVIYRSDGSEVWRYEKESNAWASDNPARIMPYIQEHVHLVRAIRTGEQVNKAYDTAVSNLVAVMGRESAYSGKET